MNVDPNKDLDMQNLSQPFPKPAHASDMKEQENQQMTIYGEERKKMFA